MKKLILSLLAIAVIAMNVPALAVTFTGSLSTPDGITATAPWSDGFSIEWTITQNADLSWKYQYSFGYDFKEISHFIVAVSPDVTADDFWDINHSGGALAVYSGDDPSNPGMPSALKGLKIDVTNDNESRYFEFISSRAPVWGDFYVKDGKYDGNEVYAYNSTFGTDDPLDDPANGSINYKILRPDTHTDMIPEPATLILMGSALALGGFSRKFLKK